MLEKFVPYYLASTFFNLHFFRLNNQLNKIKILSKQRLISVSYPGKKVTFLKRLLEQNATL